MTLLATIEASYYSGGKRSFYAKFILAAAIVLIALSAIQFSSLGTKAHPRQLVDFDDFYIVGQMVWHGDVDKAYLVHSIGEIPASPARGKTLLLWTYPPPFDVLVATFPLTSRWIAYCLFIVGSFAAYLAILRRLATESFVLALIVTFPVLVVEIRCGQNGFVTGALIGLTCLYLRRGSALAGVPLGLMAIKPHLAVAFAIYTLATRRWRTAVAACGTVAATAIVATLVLGIEVWAAFFHSIKQAGFFLAHGYYPLYRMVSFYAAARTLGLPASLAMFVQAVVAVAALTMVVAASRRFSLQQSLGLTAIASLLISPYAYDYDLPILGVGLALLLPDILQFGTAFERSLLYLSAFFACGFGLVAAVVLDPQGTKIMLDESMPVSLGGLALLCVFGLAWRILRRGQASTPQAQDATPAEIKTDSVFEVPSG
ncbi:hypothetical protein CWB41_00485 [Methylovirgula ligni]|uniref:Uncharacterized protein DUF2029 n=1 Tax=Methylovirgula ligni TaxID=569860 RepID=A0A3D9YYM0_9HYPH|nr:glycosyltransferase family 87 protein [Methylovirgula ligni]QAY94399.1 hypothetical protein CWB41_00485 [Methylovirgula ligni]REF87751.1 uncharacterized protein DUF2029 [Methylovirgula ligni]